MFYRIKNDNLYDYADYQYDADCIETDLCTMAEYQEHPNKYIVDDVEIEIEVPDYDEEGNIIGYHTETREIQQTHKETVSVKRLILNPNYEEEEAERREAEFNKAFFNTSLGYIRRAVTMADGSKKDFLSDLLPAIKIAVEAGTPVNIFAYDKPPFDEDVTDWTQYQHIKSVTVQFIQECILQLSTDFAPINNEEA